MLHHCTGMLRTSTFAFLHPPRFEVFWDDLHAITLGSCHVLLSVVVATKSSSSRTVSRVAHRGVGFLANFLSFCDGRDILVLWIHNRQSFFTGFDNESTAMSNDVSERGTESLVIRICGGAVCPYNESTSSLCVVCIKVRLRVHWYLLECYTTSTMNDTAVDGMLCISWTMKRQYIWCCN